jgi:hypothetical protein
MSAALISSAALSGCKSKEKADLSGIHETVAETMQQTGEAKETTAAEIKIEKETEGASEASGDGKGNSASQALSVRSKIATEKNGKISIEYPILSNLPSGSPQDAINALLKVKATQIVTDYELDPEKDTVSIKCNIVSLDRNKVVASYEGYFNFEGSAHPSSVYYTTSVDLSKGILMGLSDYADAYTMAGYILSDDLEIVYPEDAAAAKAVKEELQSMDIETLTDILEQCDFSSSNLAGFPQAFSYESQGTIYIAVPVSHAAGDYAIVRFSPETK